MVAATTESTMVRYFEKGLKPSIKAKMNKDATYLDNYEELVAKTVRAKAKVGLQPSFYMRETDQNYPHGKGPAYTATHKVKTQGLLNCEDDSKTFKASISASTPDCELFNKARKNVSEVTYFNYNKKSHFGNRCPKSQKSKN